MSDHEFLGPRARIEELLERRAHLELDAGHGHPGRMSAAQDEHDEPPEKEESAEKRPDAHRRREDLPHLPEHARRGVKLPIKDVKPLQEGGGDENHRQDKRELDPAEDVELQEIARIRERTREIGRADERQRARNAEEHKPRDDDAPCGRILLEAPPAQEIEEADDGERREEIRACERRSQPDFAPRTDEDGHHRDECRNGEKEHECAFPPVERGHDKREIEDARRCDAHDDEGAQNAGRLVGAERACAADLKAARLKRARVSEKYFRFVSRSDMFGAGSS